MRPLLQYYEALEAQALWEGDIRMTALIALIQESHGVADVLRRGNEIADSQLVVDLSPASSWSLGGIILTSHMLYVIAFDNDDTDDASLNADGGGSSSNAITPERRSAAGGGEFDSPEHCFEAMLSRLPLFHVVLEDVIEAVQRLEIIEQPESTVHMSGVPMAALVKLSTLAQDVRFILKSSHRFDNIDLSELVHAFGILPSVEVEQRSFSPTVDRRQESGSPNYAPKKSTIGRSVSRASDSATSQRYSARGTSSMAHTANNAASPNWDSADDPSAVGYVASQRFELVTEELEARCRFIADEGYDRTVLITALFHRTLYQLNATFAATIDAARREQLDVGYVSTASQVLSLGENAALKSLLENEERKVRVELGAYLTDSKRVSSQVLLAAERANLLRESAAFKLQTTNDFDNAQRTLKQMETALFEATSSLQEISRERDALKAREALVVENARRREADLHAQLEDAHGHHNHN
ncbi:Hypothetical protein, putative [Bodo saltans]|uniref:Uncharacterized protein n=1 Tax=Bodo saltans TaxID=75058 RepID=A0A0S4KF52_BODSA|nr:Hypothetical protein, putative [Bodo saltans]|eukprot:CUI14230.1 Hypothetical protein, putative [Bodo saltans]